MAFIAKLPDGQTILSTPGVADGWTGPYGPHLQVTGLNGGVALWLGGTRLAYVDAAAGFSVELNRLDPLTVPYVNRFINHTGQVVIRDWRTGDYRLKARRAGSKRVRKTVTVKPVAPSPKPVAKPVAVLPAPVEPSAAVITMTSADIADPIPTMEYPTGAKVVVKGAGQGWTNMDGIIMRDDDVATLERAWRLRQADKPAAVLITGPAGTSKTMLVRSFARKLGVPYLKVDCAPIRSVDDWAGGLKQDPATRTWAHRWSPFARALREGKPCVILLDELTRTESPAALNGMLGLLDGTGSMLVPDANTALVLPKGVLVVATANIGPEFVGTLPLDGAVRQRFPFGVRMDYPTEALEAKLLVDRCGVTRDTADTLVRMAVQQRMHRDDAQRFPSGSIISTRLLLSMADAITDGATPREAVWSVLKSQFDAADEAALTVIVDSQFPKPAKAPAPAEAATIVVGRHYFEANPFISDRCAYKAPGQTNVCGEKDVASIHISR